MNPFHVVENVGMNIGREPGVLSDERLDAIAGLAKRIADSVYGPAQLPKEAVVALGKETFKVFFEDIPKLVDEVRKNRARKA